MNMNLRQSAKANHNFVRDHKRLLLNPGGGCAHNGDDGDPSRKSSNLPPQPPRRQTAGRMSPIRAGNELPKSIQSILVPKQDKKESRNYKQIGGNNTAHNFKPSQSGVEIRPQSSLVDGIFDSAAATQSVVVLDSEPSSDILQFQNRVSQASATGSRKQDARLAAVFQDKQLLKSKTHIPYFSSNTLPAQTISAWTRAHTISAEEQIKVNEKTNARASLKLFLACSKNCDSASNHSHVQASNTPIEVLDATVDVAEVGIQEEMDKERRTIEFAGTNSANTASQQSQNADVKEYQNAKIRISDIEEKDHEHIEEPSFDTLFRGEKGDLRGGFHQTDSGSKKEMLMTQSILEAQIEPIHYFAENDSNYASTPARRGIEVRRIAKQKLDNLSSEEAIQHLKKALKSPRYGGLKQKGIENEFSSISINIPPLNIKKASEGLNTSRPAGRLPLENFVTSQTLTQHLFEQESSKVESTSRFQATSRIGQAARPLSTRSQLSTNSTSRFQPDRIKLQKTSRAGSRASNREVVLTVPDLTKATDPIPELDPVERLKLALEQAAKRKQYGAELAQQQKAKAKRRQNTSRGGILSPREALSPTHRFGKDDRHCTAEHEKAAWAEEEDGVVLAVPKKVYTSLNDAQKQEFKRRQADNIKRLYSGKPTTQKQNRQDQMAGVEKYLISKSSLKKGEVKATEPPRRTVEPYKARISPSRLAVKPPVFSPKNHALKSQMSLGILQRSQIVPYKELKDCKKQTRAEKATKQPAPKQAEAPDRNVKKKYPTVASASEDLAHVQEPEIITRKEHGYRPHNVTAIKKPIEEEKPSIHSLLQIENIKRQLLSFLANHINQKPSIGTFVLAMQNRALQKLVLDNYAPQKLSDFGIDHGLNSMVDTFYQKPQIVGPEEQPSLHEKSAMEVLKQLWENKNFGGSVFEPVKSAGMPAIARQGPSAPVKDAKLHTRANGLLADITSMAGKQEVDMGKDEVSLNQQLQFFSLYGVKLSRSQEAKQKLLDIHILCTDIAALKQNEKQIRQIKNEKAINKPQNELQQQTPIYHEDIMPFLTGYARVISYIAEGPDLKLQKVISLTEGQFHQGMMQGYNRQFDFVTKSCRVGFWKPLALSGTSDKVSVPWGKWAWYMDNGQMKCPEGIYVGHQDKKQAAKIEIVSIIAKSGLVQDYVKNIDMDQKYELPKLKKSGGGLFGCGGAKNAVQPIYLE